MYLKYFFLINGTTVMRVFLKFSFILCFFSCFFSLYPLSLHYTSEESWRKRKEYAKKIQNLFMRNKEF